MRTISVALCSFAFALALPAASAQAGGYGYGGYVGSHVRYSSSCCYQRVGRHRRDVFYLRAGAPLPGYVVAYPAPYVVVPRYRRVRLSEFDYYSRYGYYGHIGCYWNGQPLPEWGGGWLWGRKITCY